MWASALNCIEAAWVTLGSSECRPGGPVSEPHQRIHIVVVRSKENVNERVLWYATLADDAARSNQVPCISKHAHWQGFTFREAAGGDGGNDRQSTGSEKFGMPRASLAPYSTKTHWPLEIIIIECNMIFYIMLQVNSFGIIPISSLHF